MASVISRANSLLVSLLIFTVQLVLVDAAWREVAGAVAGGAVICVGAPLALGAIGFGAGGIVAGSLAAKAMSVVYTSGIGLGALATAQSIGAVGVSTAATVAGSAVGLGVAHASRYLQKLKNRKKGGGGGDKSGGEGGAGGEGAGGGEEKEEMEKEEEEEEKYRVLTRSGNLE